MDLTDATFLTRFNSKFLTKWQKGLVGVYSQDADLYNDTTDINYDVGMTTQDAIDLTLKGLELVNQGNHTANVNFIKLHKYIEGEYCGCYELIGSDFSDTDRESTLSIYAEITYYDLDQLSFLSDDSLEYLTGLLGSIDDAYSEMECADGDEDASISSTQDFLGVFVDGLELLSDANCEGEQYIYQCISYFQDDDTWSANYSDAAQDCYDSQYNLTQTLLLTYIYSDYEGLVFLNDDSVDFLDNFIEELKDLFAQESEAYQTHEDSKKESLLQYKQTSLSSSARPFTPTSFLQTQLLTQTYTRSGQNPSTSQCFHQTLISFEKIRYALFSLDFSINDAGQQMGKSVEQCENIWGETFVEVMLKEEREKIVENYREIRKLRWEILSYFQVEQKIFLNNFLRRIESVLMI